MIRILFLDDNEDRHDVYAQQVVASQSNGHVLIHARTAKECIKFLQESPRFDVVSLDHDLGPGPDGRDVARFIAHKMDRAKLPGEILIHSGNPIGAKEMQRTLRDGEVPCKIQPFTTF